MIGASATVFCGAIAATGGGGEHEKVAIMLNVSVSMYIVCSIYTNKPGYQLPDRQMIAARFACRVHIESYATNAYGHCVRVRGAG